MQDRTVGKSFATPLALLFHYLVTNQTTKFKETFDIFHNNNQLLKFDMDETMQSQTLLQKTVEQGNEEAFNYLIKLGYSEKKDKTDNTTITNYTKILINKMKDFDDFYKWLQLLLKNNDKLVFDINAAWNHDTILHRIFDHAPEKAQLVINCGATFDDYIPDMHNLFQALLQHKYELPKDLASKLYVAAAQHRRADVMKHLQEHGVDINFRDSRSNTALYYAVQEKDLNLVLYLLHHGAVATTAIHLAVQQKSTEIVKTLLFYGGGLFQNLPEQFHNLGLELRGCYIEGMRVGGSYVQSRMQGFARAIYSVAELKKVIDKQNRLKPGMFPKQIPVNNLKLTLEYLESPPNIIANHKALRQANAEFNVKEMMASLKFLCRLTIDVHREQMVVVEDGDIEVGFDDVVESLSENLRNMVDSKDPAQNRALKILQGRLEELQLLQQHVGNIVSYERKKFDIIKASSKWGCCTSMSMPPIFGGYVGCTYFIACLSSRSGVDFVSSKALLFFGIPGIVIATVIVVNISIISYFQCAYPAEYKEASLCCGWDNGSAYEPLANIDPKISIAREALIAVTENENLPGEVKALVEELKQADLLLSRLTVILYQIYNYYQTKVIPEIKADISYTNYNHYSDFRIFRQPPPRLQMEEDIPLTPNELTRLIPQ